MCDLVFFFINVPATTEIYTSLHTFPQHDALPISLISLLVAAVGAAGWLLLRTPDEAPEFMHPITTVPEPPKPAGPPWLYGRSDARFTVVGYADLECPYCRAYFPTLQRWLDTHPEANWQWHHLPLSMHEPAATAGAPHGRASGRAKGGQEG